jgi:predicted permease
MSILFEAIFPIFALIVLGYIFKRASFPSDQFWPMVDKFTYYVLMPSLLVYKLSFAKTDQNFSFDMIFLGILAITVVFVIFLLIGKITSYNGASYTSIIQGGIRYNTYIYLAVIDSLYGDSGLVLGILFITFAIPLINLFCIGSFALYLNDSDKISIKKIFISIIKNPLILACLLGGMINFGEIYIPLSVEKTLDILSSSALGMGLLSVGVGLEISHIKSAKSELILSSFVKLLLFPLVMYVLAYMFGIDGIEMSVLMLFASMPTAISSYILAKELGGDTKLMSSIVTVQTLLSFVTVAIVVKLL